MREWVVTLHDWMKALHVISIIAWMAALLYLPRLYVYHCAAPVGSPQSETFKVMERRLHRAIMTPAMIASWSLGVALLWSGQYWQAPWMHAKLLLVVALTGMHHVLGRWRADFAADRNLRPARTYRIANEVPTLLMIGIVILVIVRPF
jgi:putative membrane protein